jgi:Na+/H+-dicarboxylate symporter
MNKLNFRIGLSVILAILIGFILRWTDLAVYSSVFQTPLELIGELFILLLKMIMVPLIFFSLITSISSLKHDKKSKFLWQGTLIFYLSTMIIAITSIIIVMNVLQPGMNLEGLEFTTGNDQKVPEPLSINSSLYTLIKNPFDALANGNIIAVVIFSIFFGLGLRNANKNVKLVKSWFDGMFEIVMFIVNKIMLFAPFGIFALLINLIIQQDLNLFLNLSYFIAIVLGVIFFHGVVILPLFLKIFTDQKIILFWKKSKSPLITAFATSSSAASLPITINTLEQDFKVDKKVSRFMLPLGATINMDGTALYEAAVALFVANMVGINLDMYDQLLLVILAMAASIGAPAIPSAGMVTLAIVLSTLNLPLEYIALFIPIDRLIDTFRTTINVEGDIVGAIVINKFTRF